MTRANQIREKTGAYNILFDNEKWDINPGNTHTLREYT